MEMKGPEAWARRVRSLGVEAPQDSETWRAALVLLGSQELGQNIDRLARRTGASRQEVSKWARRLVDNGVWQDGETVAQWTGDPTASAAFLQDVGVATGRLLRRIGANGRMEWAEAGRWNKNFEREADDASSSATYRDAAPRATQPMALAEELERSSKSRVAAADVPEVKPSDEPVEPAQAAAEPSSVAEETAAADSPAASDSTEDKQEPEDAPSLEQVFSDAVWLR